MSLSEVLLWQQLRKRPGGCRFRRQYPIAGYVLDFACLERRLAIEVDGAAHDYGNRPARDAKRDAALASLGFATLRLLARDVLTNLDGVLEHLVQQCTNRPLRQRCALTPPRSGEEFRNAP